MTGTAAKAANVSLPNPILFVTQVPIPAGQILTLSGGASLNPTGMVINYITPKSGANGPNSLLLPLYPKLSLSGMGAAGFDQPPRLG